MNKNQKRFAELAAEKFGVSEIRKGELDDFAKSIEMSIPLSFLKIHCSCKKKGYYCFVDFVKVNNDVVTINEFIGEETESEDVEEEIVNDEDETIDEFIKTQIVELNEEDPNKVVLDDADKSFKVKLAKQVSDTFVNPVYVVFNEGQCICWGVAFSFEKAYEIAIKRALHGIPSIGEVEAKKMICKQGFVRLIHEACKFLPAVIYKVELEN